MSFFGRDSQEALDALLTRMNALADLHEQAINTLEDKMIVLQGRVDRLERHTAALDSRTSGSIMLGIGNG